MESNLSLVLWLVVIVLIALGCFVIDIIVSDEAERERQGKQ